MKNTWTSPSISTIPCNVKSIQGDIEKMPDKELAERLEKCGYQPQKKYSAKNTFIHRSIAGTDVLISVGENIANFNGYIELNKTAAYLWDCMNEPCSIEQLSNGLEETFRVPHETAVNDVIEFISQLLKHDMVMLT